jgi:hypothetical protein
MARAAATLERLNFPMPDDPEAGDYPVIAALPTFLPVAPGLTFPHLLPAGDPSTFRPTFPLFEVWRQGVTYAKANNGCHSVTVGGGLFHCPSLVLADEATNVFGSLGIRPSLPTSFLQLSPTDPLYAGGRDRLVAWSDTIYFELGSAMEPEPVAAVAAGGGFTPEHFRAAMEPLVPKAKTFALSGRTLSRYRLLLAGTPLEGSVHPERAVLPGLKEEFRAYTTVNSSATAADDLKELVRSRLSIANAAGTAIDKDVTLEPDNITLAFSDRVRTFNWLLDKLVCTKLPIAQASLSLLHFLTPDRNALALVTEGDQEAATLLMSNSTSSTAQLDASKSSKLYCGGRLTSFRHSYEAVCNLRCLFSVMTDDVATPLLLQKLLEYTSLLVDRQGRLFFDAYQRHPFLAVHPWQDLQTILSAFAHIATDSLLYGAVTRGDPVAISNYKAAVDVADSLISDLRAILNGNGLGKFEGVPVCSPWFGASPTHPIVTPPRNPEVSGAKRQKVLDAPGIDRVGPKRASDSSDADRKKSFGILQFDSAAAGTSRLPTANVYHKTRGAKTPERLCMRFLTRGFACDRADCKLPHMTNIDLLPAAEKTKLVEFVRKQPGLSWADGKAPAGTI